jgi:periplasmic protein CpxP/Spy
MKKILIVVMAISFGLVACGPQTGHMGSALDGDQMGQFIQKRLEMILDKIEATDAQRTQIQAIKDKMFADLKGLKGDPHADHEFIFAELAKAEPDAEKLHKMLDDRIDKHKAMGHKGIDAILQVHAILTPEQRAQVQTLIREKMERRHEHMKGFHKRFGGCMKDKDK